MKKRPFGLPIWTPLFILFLLLLAGVWVGVNRHGLLDMYHQQVHGAPLTRKGIECPADGMMNLQQSHFDRSMNPFKAFLSWPSKQQKLDKVDKYKPVEDDFGGQEELSKYQHDEPRFDFKMSKYQAGAPLCDTKVDKFQAQDDESDFERKLGGMDHHQDADHFSHFNLDADHLDLDANHFTQGSDHFNQGSEHFNQGADRFNQGSEHFNQGSDHYNPIGDHYSLDADQLGHDVNQLSHNVNQLSHDVNQFNGNADNVHLNRDLDMFDNIQANKPELVNSPMMDYKREFASDDANPYVESLQQRYEPLPHAYKD
ncbi:uncharacterized protein LOC6525404 isoform X2 [Drosophila yakuba]|uniref:Uncharacterized protein, isoform B n=1 Tax=Drosophila yakuba TaxID=7245 RepID=A0A0R1EBW0_DROYA|nr:uncharacterized protein LOC6525404 isoform X2 [Drosophila yakuba]KRK06719.1 uncharacterized protein Dyak_GE15735, isoform B [Drosophila yakuba]